MSAKALSSRLRFEKRRADALVRLSSGEVKQGCFFVGGGSAHHLGPERVGDLLNALSGFIPFEAYEGNATRTVLFNPAHILTVTLSEDEASRDPGYVVAPRHVVSMLLTSGQQITGTVRVYRPEGQDRVSDWTRQPEMFRYVEAGTLTLLVNTAHIVELSEVTES